MGKKNTYIVKKKFYLFFSFVFFYFYIYMYVYVCMYIYIYNWTGSISTSSDQQDKKALYKNSKIILNILICLND